MTQVWLHVCGHGPTQGEMAVRADCISALYEVRESSARVGDGRPWRIEAAVLGLPHPVVLLTAPDPERDDPPFEGALPELRDELSAELSRVQPGVEVSHGWIRHDFIPGKPAVIDWDRRPDPPKEQRLRGL